MFIIELDMHLEGYGSLYNICLVSRGILVCIVSNGGYELAPASDGSVRVDYLTSLRR